MSDPQISQRATQLRRDFDRSFAESPPPARAASVDLLAVRVGEHPYALRLSAIAGLFADKKLTPLPGATPEFLGIAGFRGAVVPVYDLRVLLGQPGRGAPRWLVVAAASPVGLAFDALEGTLRLPPEAITPQRPGESARPHLRDLVRTAGPDAPLRPLVELDSVVASIRQRMRQDVPTP